MLKLHHINLMNEVQETALMLNLYEQQHLLQKHREQTQKINALRPSQNNESISDKARQSHSRKVSPPGTHVGSAFQRKRKQDDDDLPQRKLRNVAQV